MTDKKIKNDQRSDQQVCKWLPEKPVGCIGIFVDDIICAASQEVSDALMKWIQSKWSTGQLEQISAARPGTIRFLGLNLEVVSERSATKELPV
eukprot:5596257-Amphidinium_carterae.1